jgi:carboxypeptidase C (cathepsin A)
MSGLMLGLLPVVAMALATGPGGKASDEGSPFTHPNPPETENPNFDSEQPPVVTQHKVKIGRKTLDYTATIGYVRPKNENGESDANIFFTAYTLNSAQGDPKRPLMFSFNGGPGSSSVWLHLGGPLSVRNRCREDKLLSTRAERQAL